MTVLAGVDGYKDGWVVVECRLPQKSFSWRTSRTFGELAAPATGYRVVAVDVPIGLLKAAEPGGRRCDQEARFLLKAPRASSVFSPPVRQALQCEDFECACRVNRESSPHGIGISRQSHALRLKIHEVDERMSSTPESQGKASKQSSRRCGIFEVHPELCFMELAGHPMKYSKKKANGRSDREECLLKALPSLACVIESFRTQPRGGVKQDDLMDACIACWTALRIYDGRASAIPEIALEDDRGLLIQIWR